MEDELNIEKIRELIAETEARVSQKKAGQVIDNTEHELEEILGRLEKLLELKLRLITYQREKEEREKIKEARLQRDKEDYEAMSLLNEPQYATIPELMAMYHTLLLSKVKTNPLLITSGKILRIYPERIVPWDNFVSRQQEIWDILCASSAYSKLRLKPIAHRRGGFVGALGRSFTEDEEGLVLEPVSTISKEFFRNKEVRQQLQFPGYATGLSFFSQSLENQHDITFPKTDHLALSSNQGSKSEGAKVIGAITERGSAFRLCLVHSEKELEIPSYRFDYKSPFNMSAAEILYALRGELLSARDLSIEEGKDFKFHSKRLVLAVITELFTSMIKTGVQYGYVRTGESIIFLYISDDPKQIEYHICNPRDLDLDEPGSLHKTAIAKIVAFTFQAVAAKPPPQEWHDAAAKLDTWVADYNDIVKSISETMQKERNMRETLDYETSQSATLVFHPPIALQSDRQAMDAGSRKEKEEDHQTEPSNLQTQKLSCGSQDPKTIEEFKDSGDAKGDGSSIGPSNHAKESNVGRAGKRRKGNGSETAAAYNELSKKRVHEREYCSIPCLLGLTNGGYLDPSCPNIADHGQSHLRRLDFLRLLQEQLAHDRGPVTNCEPLWIGGSRGDMFKITLSSHGYTVIAKGVQRHDEPYLMHEVQVYHHLRTMQGIHIPVCLGSTRLLLPYYHRGGKYMHFLLLSYAGVPLYETINKANKRVIISKVTHALKAIHGLRVLHCDAEPRNIMTNSTDEESGWAVQIVDFERAEIQKEEVDESTMDAAFSRELYYARRFSANLVAPE